MTPQRIEQTPQPRISWFMQVFGSRTLYATATSSVQKMQALAVAMDVFGPEKCAEFPSLINLAMLRLSFGRRLCVHQAKRGAVRLTADTQLDVVPTEAPSLLRRAWVVEVRNPEKGECLFDDVVALAGYPIEGYIWLIGMNKDMEICTSRWMPRWTGEAVENAVQSGFETMVMATDVDRIGLLQWTRAAARFALTFALLLEAKNSPLRTETEVGVGRQGKGARRPAKGESASEWVTRHVYLSDPPPRASSATEAVEAGQRPLGDGWILEPRTIRRHMRRQRYGVGRAQVEWIYVESYEGMRWVLDKNVRVIAH